MADAPVSKTGEHQARVGSTPSFGITEAIRIGSGSGLENRRPEMVCRFDSCRLVRQANWQRNNAVRCRIPTLPQELGVWVGVRQG
jgi:hypothetical protein